MDQIFISYANEDRPKARTLSETLEAEGWSVWWDREIPSGSDFATFIEERLNGAACVLVLWSENSVESIWVRAEADEALKAGKLIPIAIDGCAPPLVFRQIQTADLADWQGSGEHPAYQKLVTDITALIGPPAARKPPIIPPQEEAKPVDHADEKIEKAKTPGTPDGAREQPDTSGHRPVWKNRKVIASVLAFVVLLAAAYFLLPFRAPEIVRFESNYSDIFPKNRLELSWETRNGATVTLTPAGKVEPAGSINLTPSETQTYRLVAENLLGQKVEQSLRVTVKPLPKVLEFSATPETIERGQSATLRWRTEDADSVELDNVSINPNDSMVVSPETDRIYALDIESGDGEKSQHYYSRTTLELKVVEPTPAPQSSPEITQFEASPSELTGGGTVVLSYSVKNVERVFLNGRQLADAPSGAGSNTIPAKINETTTFHLRAENAAGQGVAKSLTVTVLPVPVPEKPTPVIIYGGGSFIERPRTRKVLASAARWQALAEKTLGGKVVTYFEIPVGAPRLPLAEIPYDPGSVHKYLSNLGVSGETKIYLYATSERLFDLAKLVSGELNRFGIVIADIKLLSRSQALSRAKATAGKDTTPVLVIDDE